MSYRINYLRFSLWFLGLSIALPLTLNILGWLFDTSLQSTGATMIPIMIAALIEGQKYAQANERRPAGGEAWSISLQLAVCALAWTILLTVVMMLIFPQIMGGVGLGLIAIMVVVFALLFWLLARIFFGLGAKTMLRQLEAKNGKS